MPPKGEKGPAPFPLGWNPSGISAVLILKEGMFMRKKSLALLLALVMLLSLAVPSAMAEEPEDPAQATEEPVQQEEEGPAQEDTQAVAVVTETVDGLGSVYDVGQAPMLRPMSILGGGFDWNNGKAYYAQLDSDSQDVYDKLYASDLGEDYDASTHSVSIEVEVEPWDNVPVNYVDGVDGKGYSLPDGNVASQWISNTVVPAWLALIYDRPELSWLVSANFNYGASFSLSHIQSGDSGYTATVTLKSLTITVTDYSSQTGTAADYAEALAAAKSALAESPYNINDAETRYDQAKAIHDYVCETLTYSSTTEGRLYQTVYSALVAPYHTVCAGYSKAFKVLCDEYGIPCVLVSGTGTNSTGKTEAHMWNYVQMEDGNWYAVDCTWDDPVGGSERSIYFLVGANTMVDGRAFSNSHSSSGDWNGAGTYSFTYPNLAAGEYKVPQELTGSVTISGIAKYGETLTATVEGAPAGASLIYQWYRGNTAIDTMGNTYALTAADVGETIQVKVTALGYTGSLTATAGPVKKADGPAAPIGVTFVPVSMSWDTLTVAFSNSGANWEYACVAAPAAAPENGWKAADVGGSVTFTDLEPETAYNIYVRVAGTDTQDASAASLSGSLSTISAPIDAVTVSGLEDPVKGSQLDTAVEVTPAGKVTAEVTWYKGNSAEGTAVTGAADANQVYTAKITLRVTNDQDHFAESVTVTLNGESLGMVESGSILSVTKTFPATAEREIQSFTASANPNPVAVPKKGETATVTLTATATYDDGSSGTVNASWELVGAHTGVELSGKTITIAPEAGTYGENIEFTVNASYNEQWGRVKITLSKETAQATTIDISGPETLAIPGSATETDTGKYTATVYDQYGEKMQDKAVAWSIDDVNGVSVDQTGTVTVNSGAAADTVTLTATCDDVKEIFEITLSSKLDAGVTITGVPAEVVEGSNYFELYAQIQGSSAPDYNNLLWSSNDENVLYIQNLGTKRSGDGLQAFAGIAVKGPGKATITATYEDDTHYGSASVTITVLEKPTLDDFNVTPPSNAVYNGQEHPVTVTCGKEDMQYTVRYNGSTNEPVNAGTYDVTLEVEKANGYAAATFDLGSFTIDKATPAITVDNSLNMVKGTTQSLGAAISNNGTLTYQSRNPSVATVDGNGNVKGVAEGKAIITVSYAGDNNHEPASATVNVTVTDKNQVTVDFADAVSQTYKPDGYALGAQFSEATVEGGKAITKYIYDNTEYTSLSALPTVYNAGTYTVTAVYDSATEHGEATATFTINKANQAALTINSVGTVTYGTPVELTASGGSGTGEVTFAVTDGTGKATVSGSTLTPVQAGTVTVTATKDGDNNYNSATSATVEITINKAAYSGPISAAGSAKYGSDGTVDLSGLIVPGGTATVGTVTDGDSVLEGTPTISNGGLTFTLVNDSGKVGKTATISVSVTSDNYEDYTITVTVTVNDKNTDTTTMKVSLKGWTYGDAANTPSVSGVSGGTAVYSYSGTGSTTYGPSATVPTAAGTYRVTATYENDDTIYTAAADFTIAKADPVIGTVSVSTPATIFTSTDPEAVTLSWTNTAITGTLKLADGTQFTSGTKSYTWVFSPTDTANYNSVQGTIRLSVTANALQSIAVTTQPTKTAYQYGEAFDPAGMVVTATYADGSGKTVDNSKLTVRYAAGSGFNAGDTSVTLSYTEDGVTKTCAVTGLTVSKIAYPGTTSAAGSAKYGSSGTVNLSAMIAPGGTLGTPAVTSGSDILSGTPTLSGGVLTFAFKDNADNVNQDAVITIPVTGAANYNDYTITVTVTVTDKLTPTVTVKDITVTYTGSPVPASAIRGTATYGGETVKGTWSWYGKSPTNVAESDLYLVCFTPEDSDTYATVVKLVNVTINKATPTGTPKYTAVTEDGKTLEDVALSASGFSVPGTVKWVDDEDTLVRANTAYQWTFTPADRANYNVVSGKLTPYRVYDDDDDTPVEGSIVSAPAASHGSVRVDTGRAEKGDTVTITAIPDEGYVLESIVVTDRYGDTVRLTNEGDGVFSFTMPGSAITVKTVFVPEGSATVSQEMDFADVGESHWAYNEIAWAFENGYMNGTGTATFHPTGSVTRQQVWMILARMSGADPANMAEAKNWAVNNGVSDGSNPGSPVTRQQLVALLYRFAGQMGYDTAARADLSGYPDAASVSSYAADAMAWSVANSIVGGTTAGTLNPTGTANRAQFAAILWRFYQSSQS